MLTKQQEEKLNTLCKYAIESLVGQIVVDTEGTILYFSKEHVKFLGIQRDEAEGKYVRDILPNTRMDVILKTGVPEIGRIFEMKHKETGETKYMVCNRMPIRNEKGEIVGALSETVFSRGINDIHRLDQEVKHHTNQNLFTKESDYYKLSVSDEEMQMMNYPGDEDSVNRICGHSPEICSLKSVIAKVADMPLTVLITGETGPGKEVFADALHRSSIRRDKHFVKINCAAIPKELLESELFGYEKGAFSGASSSGKTGKFEYAAGGTILLDEIGDMPLDLQAKLLRVLQEREFERIGGLKSIPFDARVICTTNRDVVQLVKEGKFREDLYYRINVLEMYIPPLRERTEDIMELSRTFIAQINNEYELSIEGIDADTQQFLECYDWPGNVRELKHAIERACMMRGSGTLSMDDFDFFIRRISANGSSYAADRNVTKSLDLKTVKMEAEKKAIETALKITGGNKKSAANILGIERTVLYDKLKKYDMNI